MACSFYVIVFGRSTSFNGKSSQGHHDYKLASVNVDITELDELDTYLYSQVHRLRMVKNSFVVWLSLYRTCDDMYFVKFKLM